MTRRTTTAVLALFAMTSLLAACGSDDDTGSASTATTAESETEASYAIVSDAEVASGYASLIAKMTTLSTDAASVDSAALDEDEALWFAFEGTVKQSDADSYLASEEALDAFNTAAEAKDAAGMAAATTKMSTTASTYVAAHPG